MSDNTPFSLDANEQDGDSQDIGLDGLAPGTLMELDWVFSEYRSIGLTFQQTADLIIAEGVHRSVIDAYALHLYRRRTL